jgi:hypothetical protein
MVSDNADGGKSQLTGSCLLAMVNARLASSQSFLFFARIPKTCHVIWLPISFLTAVLAISSASACLGAPDAVSGKFRDECKVRALRAIVSNS